jgi:hypothetical protein
MRMAKAYWRSVHKLAATETFKSLGLESRDRLVIAILLAFIYLAVVWELGGRDAASGELLLKVAATMAPLIAFPAIYLWKFFRVPARMAAEAEEAQLELRRRLDRRAEINEKLRKLSDQLAQGHSLMQQKISNDNEFAAWIERTSAWAEETRNQITTAISLPAATAFYFIESVQAADYSGVYNSKHNSKKLYLSVHVSRLRDLINQYDHKTQTEHGI